MGQSLAEAAVRGTSSTTVADEKQQLLASGDITGLMELNRSLYGGFQMKLEDDADDDADDDSDDEDEDDADDDEDDDDDEDKGKKKPTAEQRRIQELSAESKKHRLRASQRGKRIRELEQELESLKTKPKPKAKAEDDEDDDKSDSELEAERTKNRELQERLVRQQLRTEFTDLVTGPKALAQFKNPRAAFKLLDLDDVEIDDDGDIVGLDDAIKQLAEDEPYLLVSSKDGEDDDEDEDEVTKRRRRKTGQPTGGAGRKKGNPNRDKLLSKYPALRR